MLDVPERGLDFRRADQLGAFDDAVPEEVVGGIRVRGKARADGLDQVAPDQPHVRALEVVVDFVDPLLREAPHKRDIAVHQARIGGGVGVDQLLGDGNQLARIELRLLVQAVEQEVVEERRLDLDRAFEVLPGFLRCGPEMEQHRLDQLRRDEVRIVRRGERGSVHRLRGMLREGAQHADQQIRPALGPTAGQAEHRHEIIPGPARPARLEAVDELRRE